MPCRDVDLPAEEMEVLRERANVSSALCVPLLTDHGMLYGVLTVYRVVDPTTGALRFHEEEVEIATRLADYATASVQRFCEGAEGGEA